MDTPAMKYLGQRPKYEIYRVAVYEIRCAYEILSLWDNMVELAGANIFIKTNLPKQRPGSNPGFLFCQAGVTGPTFPKARSIPDSPQHPKLSMRVQGR